MVKVCSTCKQEKELSNFYKSKDKKDGLEYRCKECVKLKDKKFRLANRRNNSIVNLEGTKICIVCKKKNQNRNFI